MAHGTNDFVERLCDSAIIFVCIRVGDCNELFDNFFSAYFGKSGVLTGNADCKDPQISVERCGKHVQNNGFFLMQKFKELIEESKPVIRLPH